jgi:thiol-disulfide isomerase/thioredoxin
MSTAKKISLIAVILAVIGSIWYLERIKAYPGAGGAGSQEVDVNALLANGSSSAAAAAESSTASGTAATAGTGATGVPNGVAALSAGEKSALRTLAAQDKLLGDQPAIEIADPTGFINAPSSFRIANEVGSKVVLLDFWTYSCINCVRTIPYLNAWYQKYAPYGLEIVGIHTPEFDFEKQISNVRAAVAQYGIHYPVILDSKYGTWNAYNNLYWPHEYLIDMAGYIVHDQIGEGNYAETETEIQKLLRERAQVLGLDPNAIPTSTVDITPQNLNGIQSPETYFGAERNSSLADGEYFTNGTQTLTAPAESDMKANYLYLGGTWNFADQYAENTSAGATVTFKYVSGKVYMVAAGAPAGTVVDVMQDGAPVSAADAGSDVHDGKVTISANKLYNLVNNADGDGTHTLELIVESPGLQAYTFTFG